MILKRVLTYSVEEVVDTSVVVVDSVKTDVVEVVVTSISVDEVVVMSVLLNNVNDKMFTQGNKD